MNAMTPTRTAAFGGKGLLLLPVLFPGVAAALLWRTDGWILMWGVAVALFLALKIVTAADAPPAPAGRLAGYLLLWPGLDARAFFPAPPGCVPASPIGELVWALGKFAGGLAACLWAARHAFAAAPLLVAWVGMLGLIFTLHFGAMHVASWAWRRAGVNAPPIMRAPIVSDSLAALWGGRWNAAFADTARRFLLRPLAPRLGARGAGAVVFLVSGLVHEVVISLPARGGWGGPTIYFLLQAAGIAAEKSATGRRVGLGRGFAGWLWMAVVALGPLPLLFHRAFAERVILPQFQFLHALLP